ncbi:MAG: hypothetical protein DLM66_12790 [Candidatus Dormiibacter spiritus]|nr:MAG: hypothetical protein DLM66_12790 [Candidatus Dormibacteraeota bacterium]
MARYSRPSGPLGSSLSWSQVAMVEPSYKFACGRKWGYSRILQLREPPGIRLIAGRAYDEGINALLGARMAALSASEALNTAWKVAAVSFDQGIEGFREPLEKAQADSYAVMVEAAIACFHRELPGLVPAALQSDHSYTVRTADGGSVSVRGRSDYIEPDGTIVENKLSGLARWNREGEWDEAWVAEHRDQLVLYWLARRAEERRGIAQPAPVVPRARFDVIHAHVGLKEPKLRSLVLEFDVEDERRALAAVRNANAIIRDGRLSARPGPACDWCGFRDRCRADEVARGASFSDLVGLRKEVVA